MSSRVFAAADIGSNTAHLLVAATDGSLVMRIDNYNEWIPLGEVVTRVGSIPKEVTQDLVDSWQMSNVLQLPCNPRATTGSSVCNSTWVSAMNTFRDSMVAAYAPLLHSPVNGGYLSTCYQHCHQNIDDVYRKEIVGNSTVEAAFWKWWTGGGGGVLLDGEWNTNGQCFGSPYCAHGENNQ